MKTWQDFFNEKMPKEYTDRVMQAAQAELAAVSASEKPRLFARWSFAGGLAAAVLAFVLLRNQSGRRPHSDVDDMLTTNSEMLEHQDLLSELDTLEAWEEIEKDER